VGGGVVGVGVTVGSGVLVGVIVGSLVGVGADVWVGGTRVVVAVAVACGAVVDGSGVVAAALVAVAAAAVGVESSPLSGPEQAANTTATVRSRSIIVRRSIV
jgi:hypothetical protein